VLLIDHDLAVIPGVIALSAVYLRAVGVGRVHRRTLFGLDLGENALNFGLERLLVQQRRIGLNERAEWRFIGVGLFRRFQNFGDALVDLMAALALICIAAYLIRRAWEKKSND